VTEDSDPIDRVVAFARRLQHVCEATGIDFAEVFEGTMPTPIRADEAIGLYLSQAERDMVIKLDDISDETKAEIRDAPATKRKFKFPLAQINEIETAVSMSIQRMKNPRRWKTLVRKLGDIQTRYMTEEEYEDAGVVPGQTASKEIAVGNLLITFKRKREGDGAKR
jgi:hypothetical protein